MRRPTRGIISANSRCTVTGEQNASSSIRSSRAAHCSRVWTASIRRGCSVVYPGVAAEFVKLARERGDGRTILSVGTIEPRKNLELLVRALAQLPGARLVAVGPRTPYALECAALAQRLGVADRLEMRGYVSREDLLALHASCAAVAVPSSYEGFGYAAAQALCAGVPCIVSDRTSLPEVSGGDAPIVALDDLDGWCAQLTAALRGDLDASAASVRARSAQRFSWDAAADRMLAVYASSLN